MNKQARLNLRPAIPLRVETETQSTSPCRTLRLVRKASPLALLAMLTLLASCSTLDAINPFSSNTNKAKTAASLQAITSTASVRTLWVEQIGKSGDYVFSPAIVGDSVYAASKEGALVRIDAGKVRWRIKTGQILSGGVGANESTVVLGSPKGDLLAFAADDGRLLWKRKASSEILAAPVLNRDLVIVRSGDNRLAAYDLLDGSQKWLYQRSAPALSLRASASPILTEKYVFAGFPGGKLIAVSVQNGTPLWEGTVALPKGTTELDRVADITSQPVIDGQSICAVAFQGRVACFDLNSGNLTWARALSSVSGLAIDQRYVYVSDDKGALHALDKTSGASVWKQDKLFMRNLSAPSTIGRFIAVADAEGIIHFLNREDGAFAARLSTDGSAISAPLRLLEQKLIAQTRNGGVYAIGIQ
ncbi:MAG: outer membrane protein assembly factor BamB [Pseudomonadota bacterium]